MHGGSSVDTPVRHNNATSATHMRRVHKPLHAQHLSMMP